MYAAGLDFLSLRGRLEEAGARLLAARSLNSWEGPAATTAKHRLTVLLDNHVRMVAGVWATGMALLNAADALGRVQGILSQAEQRAREFGWFITDSGDVVAPFEAFVRPADPLQLAAGPARTEILDFLEVARWQADAVDDALARGMHAASMPAIDRSEVTDVLREVTAYAVSVVEAPPQAPPPLTASPFAIAAWWLGLSDAERWAVLRSHPDVIGRLDGLPGGVRDAANRLRLDAQEAGCLAELERLTGLGRDATDELGRWLLENSLLPQRGRVGELARRLQLLRDVRAALDRGPDGYRRYLLQFDPDADEPRVAIGVGDIETARFVTTVIPGFSSDTGELRRLTEEVVGAVDLATTLDQRGADPRKRRDGSVAGVLWLGYRVPWLGTSLDRHDSVLSSGSAEDGAILLRRFLLGVGAQSRDGTYQSAIGHSYGSLVLAWAARGTTGLRAIALVGSPGTGAASTGALKVPPRSVFVLHAYNDPIARTNWFGEGEHDTDHLPGIRPLSTGDAIIAGLQLRAVSGHSGYFVRGSTSLFNLATIIINRADDAVVARVGQDDFGDDLSWPLPTLVTD